MVDCWPLPVLKEVAGGCILRKPVTLGKHGIKLGQLMEDVSMLLSSPVFWCTTIRHCKSFVVVRMRFWLLHGLTTTGKPGVYSSPPDFPITTPVPMPLPCKTVVTWLCTTMWQQR